MTQIRHHDGQRGRNDRFERMRIKLAKGIKWWAEHQAWPATDEIRIERHRTPRG